jgi:glutamate-1-semialdehyde 2,1-aminomutase
VKELEVVAIIQARLGSTRLPNKVLADLGGVPVLEFLVQRLRRSKMVEQIVLAIPDTRENSLLISLAQRLEIPVVLGSEKDVLSRFATASRKYGSKLVVRITGDCPFIDPEVVDEVVRLSQANSGNYSRTSSEFPDGFDTEVFRSQDLYEAESKAVRNSDREHVTPYVARMSGHVCYLEASGNHSALRVTLDEPEDLTVLRKIVDYFGSNTFGVEDVINLSNVYKELFVDNLIHSRNEGSSMSAGEKLWKRAKRVIPGGNMLLSKRAEMYLQKGWPTYFEKASGVEVTDIDGNVFLDCGLMGVGTNILGYGHPEVDAAVLKTIALGNMSTFNCPEEVYLAEKLVEMHPWSSMARFTRSGGEACAVAVRIARAHSGKSAVAFCGYHGWHDWYLSANLAENSSLDGHLLPGLMPSGVPRGLAGTARPFTYNDSVGLEEILLDGDVGVIFMEVRRSDEPEPGFLEEVRRLADKYEAVLVFDECTSGFRRSYGGLHLDYGVNPDIATFGKTLGNGYAICAIIGRQEFMQSAQETFISSTFWTERIGPTAALATLEVMAREDAPNQIDLIGKKIQGIWSRISREAGLTLHPSGLPSLSTYAIEEFELLPMKTYVTQQMLKRGFIAGNAFYASIAHTDSILQRYEENLLVVFQEMANFSNSLELESHLDSGLAQSGFKRLA